MPCVIILASVLDCFVSIRMFVQKTVLNPTFSGSASGVETTTGHGQRLSCGHGRKAKCRLETVASDFSPTRKTKKISLLFIIKVSTSKHIQSKACQHERTNYHDFDPPSCIITMLCCQEHSVSARRGDSRGRSDASTGFNSLQ